MKNLLFQVINEDTKLELEKKGLEDSYLIIEEGAILVGGRARKQIDSENAILIEENLSVDWDDQWKSFAQNYSDGKAHIDLGPFGELLLYPGAGFGDLSHPTTVLMLDMMQNNVLNRWIVDLGSGSGILTLSALLMGARSAVGVEIDDAALKHARKNAKLNSLQGKFLKHLPKNLPQNPLFLMNMILPEQKFFDVKKLKGTWIISGILISQKKEYLKLTSSWGLIPIKTYEKEGWMGFIFHN